MESKEKVETNLLNDFGNSTQFPFDCNCWTFFFCWWTVYQMSICNRATNWFLTWPKCNAIKLFQPSQLNFFYSASLRVHHAFFCHCNGEQCRKKLVSPVHFMLPPKWCSHWFAYILRLWILPLWKWFLLIFCFSVGLMMKNGILNGF